jgi:hypothetical protein
MEVSKIYTFLFYEFQPADLVDVIKLPGSLLAPYFSLQSDMLSSILIKAHRKLFAPGRLDYSRLLFSDCLLYLLEGRFQIAVEAFKFKTQIARATDRQTPRRAKVKREKDSFDIEYRASFSHKASCTLLNLLTCSC